MIGYLKKRLINLSLLVRREVFRDQFLLEVKRWFNDDGDNTLRLDYPLSKDSEVWDLGGYKGDFAGKINDQYGSRVVIFEPVKKYFDECVYRFKDNDRISCYNFGLSARNGFFDISIQNDGSTFSNESAKSDSLSERAELRSIVEFYKESGANSIDLMKINIEGGEYEVLPELIKSGLVSEINYFQIQFHNFIEDAESKRDSICKELEKTHIKIWDYPFVWECWKLKD